MEVDMRLETGLAFVVFFPFAAGLLAYGAGSSFGGKAEVLSKGRENLRDGIASLSAVLEFVGILVLAVISCRGAEGKIFLEISEVCGLGLSFVLDGFRAVYGGVAAFLWMMATIFSRDYFARHLNSSRFYLFLLWTLGATLGVFLSADLFTTFLFFELMSFTSYVWVVQEENSASLRAGATYLAVAVIGGLVMLMGLFLLDHQLGTLAIRELSVARCEDRRLLYLAGGCLLFGFGAKAGVFPLHIWLPKAHPVAPAPASALLSGILTKSGIYGILILSFHLFPQDANWGALVLGLGVITMLGGALLALFSIDLKRTLACSSMSQIGFILVGIGMQGLAGGAAVAGAEEQTVLSAYGVLLHMVNHSLIKLVLFLAAGVIHRELHTMDLNVIRGFGRKKPLLAGCFAVGALAIGGIPLFGGYISKTLLHEGIVEYGGGGILRMVEWIFLFSGGLTVAYMTKLFVAVFVERNADAKLQERYEEKKEDWSPATVFSLAGSAAVLLIWGLFPHALMERLANLAVGFLNLKKLEQMGNVSYFSFSNLKGGLLSIGIGVVVYLFFVRKVLIQNRKNGGQEYVNLWPKWLDLEELLYRPILLRLLPALSGVLCRILDSLADAVTVALRRTIFRDTPLPHERTEGNAFTEALGKLLNGIQGLGNHTWRRTDPAHRDYVHLTAMKHEEIKENNLIIQRSLSFGLLLFCVGLSLVLLYLIWW